MADKREEKKKKKERTPGTFAQMKQVYQMTKKSDPNIGWILSLSALGTLLVFLLIGIALGKLDYFPDSGSGRCRYCGDASAGSPRADCGFCSD